MRLVLACEVALSFGNVRVQSFDGVANAAFHLAPYRVSAVGSPFPQHLHGYVQEGSHLLLSQEGRFDP